jgi:hypothetical protein
MTVDTTGTAITEFDIGAKEKVELIERGRDAARDFLRDRARRPTPAGGPTRG